MITSAKLLKVCPYIILGSIIFAANSANEANYFWKGSLILLEAKVVIVALFFILARAYKSKKIISK
jgi:hypothetical protein